LKKVVLALALFVLAGGGTAVYLRGKLNQDWVAMTGMLRIKKGMPEWYFDREDPDQLRVASRLQRVYQLTDAKGSVLQSSDVYPALDDGSPVGAKPTWKIRRDERGYAYLIRSGVVYSNDRARDPYFVAIGRPLGRW